MKLQPLQRDKLVRLLDQALLYSLYGLVLFIPASKSLVEIFFSLALIIFAAKKILRPDFKFLKTPHYAFLFLFFAFNCLSLFNSGRYFYKSLDALLFKWLEWILIFLIAEDTLSNSSRIRSAAAVLLSASAVIGMDGLSQRFLGIEFLRQRDMVWINQGFYGVTASFEHYNSFGTYLTFVLLVALSALLFGRLKKPYQLGLAFVAVLSVALLILTFSRGSWLGFLAGLVLMLILSRKNRTVLLMAAFFVILLISLPAVRERAFFVFQRYGTSERFAILEICWKMIKENPLLGKGVGTFMDYCSLYTSGEAVRYAHNCYLQILAESGAFALASFLIFLGNVLYRSVRSLKENFDYILLGFLSAIFGFLVQSFLDIQLYSLQLSALFWFFMGAMSSLNKLKRTGGISKP